MNTPAPLKPTVIFAKSERQFQRLIEEHADHEYHWDFVSSRSMRQVLVCTTCRTRIREP